MRRVALALLGTALLSGCAASLPPVDENMASRKAGGATLETLREGRRDYVRSCSGCHSLHLPNEYTKDQWPVKLAAMQERAKISDRTRESIRIYLEAAGMKNETKQTLE